MCGTVLLPVEDTYTPHVTFEPVASPPPLADYSARLGALVAPGAERYLTAQVATSPTSGAEEFARIAGPAIAQILKCGEVVLSIVARDMLDFMAYFSCGND